MILMEYLSTKVTTINNIYHCRLLKDGRALDEMACKLKEDIGYCIRYMLRIHNKLGGTSSMADASRHRGKNIEPKGKIWYSNQLPVK